MTSQIISANGIILRSSDRFAGGIDSIVYNNIEMIDSNQFHDDYGRELQSAIQFDGKGEEINPTECGSQLDFQKPSSSSVLLERSVEGSTLRTKTHMAYWYPVNGQVLSDCILSKKLTIGHPAGERIIQIDLSFDVQTPHGWGQFEVITGYMPVLFIAHYGLDLATGQLKRLTVTGEQPLPVIASAEDGSIAMGCYCPADVAYGSFLDALHLNVVKWNAVNRVYPTPVGQYPFTAYIVIGTLEEVRQDMIRLHNYLNNTVITGGGMKYVTCEQYLSIQQDVRLAGADPLQHALSMVVNGPHEPRCLSYPEELDTIEGQRAYIEAWPDLKAAFGTDYSQALPHYLSCGWREPRYPLPGTWVPPKETKVFGELPGPFFMSGMPFEDGLRIGTYKDSAGIARLYKYDGAFHELWSAPCESVYHIQRRKNGRVMFSTESPAGIGIEGDDGKITWRQLRGEPDSLAFDIWPYRGGWMVFTVSNVTYTRIKIYTSQDDGVTWQLYREHSCNNGIFKQCCTDGQTYYLYGHKDRFPYIEREDGKQVIWMKDYKDQEINNAAVADDLFTIGMNNIDALIEDGTRRNGYVMYGTTGGMYHSGIDLKAPWIMQTDISPAGRYAVASIWNESGYPNPEIAYSKDGRTGWAQIASVPFPSVQTMDYGDGGIYCFGGKYGQFGGVWYSK